MLPFSRRRPPTIPATAKAIPRKVAKSSRIADLAAALVFLFCGCAVSAMRFQFGFSPLRSENQPAEFDNALDHFIGGFAHAQYLTGGEGDYGIWRNFDMLNQVRVENE